MSQLIEDRVQQGRDAYRRHAWHEAFDSFREADAETPLSPEDLRVLAPVFHDKCLIGVAVDLEVCGLPFLGCGRWL
jgi:hypothetical protein